MMGSLAACRELPPLLSSFVDAFVDFSVSGLFLPTAIPNPNPNPNNANVVLHHPAPARLVAIGDLHGDLAKAKEAFDVAGIVDPATDRWIGGATVAVQVGDVLDRGGDEIRLLYLLHRLKFEASTAGGALLTIIGNHEVMNVDLDFRFAYPSGLSEFARWGNWYRTGIAMKRLCEGLETPHDPFVDIPADFPGVKKEYTEGIRSRIAALRSDGGPIAARFLAGNQTVVVVGDSVFVHGGISREHVAYGLDRINGEVREWIGGSNGRRRSPEHVRGKDSVVWLRKFSDGERCDCESLREALEGIPGARRMVMGHTIQGEGINGVCGNQAVRVDVGLSKGCGDGLPEVLEIVEGREARILTGNEFYRRRSAFSPAAPGGGGEIREGMEVLFPEKTLEVEVQA